MAQSQEPALQGGEASPGAGAGGAAGKGDWPCFRFPAGWPQSCLEPQGGPAGAPVEQKACSRHWPGLQPPLPAAWDHCTGVQGTQPGPVQVRHSPGPPQQPLAAPQPLAQRPVLQGSGWSCSGAVGPWVCLSLPVGLGGAREEGRGWGAEVGAAGKGLWPHLHAGPLAPERPTPLCPWPGSQSQPLWWPLPPRGTQAWWGAWPEQVPPPHIGRAVARPDLSGGEQVAGPRQGLSLRLGAGFAVLYPHLLVRHGEAARRSTL